MSTTLYTPLSDRCDVAYAMDMIGGKWKISIIWELARHPNMRLSALRRNLTGISEGVLIAQLKELEASGIVLRTVFPVVPPHVEYALTPRGERLVDTIRSLDTWGKESRQEILGESHRAQ